MLAALALAAAASGAPAAMPSFVPDVYYGPDGCRWVRKAAKPAKAKPLVVQWAKPAASAPVATARAASAPAPRKRILAKPARAEMPGYDLDGCAPVLPSPLVDLIVPPTFSRVELPNDLEPAPPVAAGDGPEAPSAVPVRDVPSFAEMASGPGSGYGVGPPLGFFPPGGGSFPPRLIPISTPPIPEPEAIYLLLAGLGALAWIGRRR